MPHGARSAAGGMSALSLRLKASDDRRPGATTLYGEWGKVTGIGGLSGFLLPTFLCRCKEK
jgi:hypothetical protein